MVFIWLVVRQTGPGLVKRRQALVETNLSRNSQLETHRSDEPGSRVEPAPYSVSMAGLCAASRIDRFPHALKNSRWMAPQQFGPRPRLRTRPEICSPGPSGAGADCSTD